MTENTLTSEEKRCLQMWFRQAIVEVERREACAAITKFYNGESKTRNVHKSPATPRRAPRTRTTRTHELV